MLTETGALKSLADIDAAITQVSSFRASFGAVENRIDALSITNTLKLNTEASRSRIQDADFAAETSRLTKAQFCRRQQHQCLHKQTLQNKIF